MGLLLAAYLSLPTLAIAVRALGAPAAALLSPAVLEALRLSVATSTLAMALVVALGTPLAYLLARHEFRGRRLLDAVVDLPLVLPPVIAGLGLLLVFGRRGPLGGLLEGAGLGVAFTTAAVVMAQVFVATPYFVRTLKVGLASVPREVEAAALTDGAGRWLAFWSVTLPVALPAATEGLVLAWSRALAEFGATLVFAGSLMGRTRTLPLATYAALESGVEESVALALVLTVLSLSLFALSRAALRPREAGRG